jgi:transcriptional regulator with XRE-family HTH domain
MNEPQTHGALLGRAVRELRLSRGIGLGKLARLAAASKSHLSRLENGEVASPTTHLIQKLAKALGISEQDLLRASLGEVDGDLSWNDKSFLVRFVEAPPHRRRLIIQVADAAMNALTDYDEEDHPEIPEWQQKVDMATHMLKTRPGTTVETIQRRIRVRDEGEAKLLHRIASKRARRGS